MVSLAFGNACVLVTVAGIRAPLLIYLTRNPNGGALVKRVAILLL